MLRQFVVVVSLACGALAVHAGATRNVTLDVKGMDCAACPVTVKVVLKRLPGVDDVKMDDKSHTAVVKFDPEKVSPELLAQAVTDAGYPASFRK